MERLAKRSDHFMSPQLLGSQIAEMEPFAQQVPLLRLDVAGSVEQLLLQLLSFTVFIRAKLGLNLALPSIQFSWVHLQIVIRL